MASASWPGESHHGGSTESIKLFAASSFFTSKVAIGIGSAAWRYFRLTHRSFYCFDGVYSRGDVQTLKEVIPATLIGLLGFVSLSIC
ncbi:hypothetical protein [Acidovorax sp. LjRoot194]|uniref:hypothetical protein n=1 Tax=Acidovorax sp. LjRoot194 TaxID=3342280 RepID=UPI003ECF5BF6